MLRYSASRATALIHNGTRTRRVLWYRHPPPAEHANRRHHLSGSSASKQHGSGRSLDIQEEHGSRREAVHVTRLVRTRHQKLSASSTRPSSTAFDYPVPESTNPLATTASVSSGNGSLPANKGNVHDALPRIAPEALNVVVSNIHHWCAKDPSFFHATIQKLNLPSIADQHEADNVTTELLRQHRQLYHQSIPDFRTHICENDPLALQPALRELVAVGFGDRSFSKRYRAVRAYESRKKQLHQLLIKQQADLEHRQQSIQKAERELESLKAAARKSAQEQRINMAHRLRRQQPSPVGKETTLSFSSAWYQLLSWLVGGSEDPRTAVSGTDASAPATVNLPESRDCYEPFSPPTNRARIRVSAKVQAIASLKQDLEAAMEQLNEHKIAAASLECPLPIQNYDRARRALEKHRGAICQELAQQFYEQHVHLMEQYQLLNSKTDLTNPWDWFGPTRLDRRKIIFHSGPTNSGKTYTALERLKMGKEGLYLAPLRLLAAEVYDNLTSDGICTNLYTGQERRDTPFATHTAATVEMASTDVEYDVVVIDEIQMIADVTRGAAWTKALLGLRCKEIHVCGGSEARTIVRKLADACGDEFEVKEYERFSPLEISSQSFATDASKPGCYRKVQPGDCVVAFSRNDIFAIKLEIEKTTGYKCCVIYGTLPPETRAEEARRFNDPDSGYDILVASDAIGMGLNLSIKRVIFHSIFKYNGEKVIRLSHSEIKQISGRAGRRNSPYPHGEVTCRDPRDLPYIRQCLQSEIPQIKKAAILPTSAHIEVFREGLEVYGVGEDFVDLHNILMQFRAMAAVNHDLFFLGCQSEMQMIAEMLQGIPLSLQDAYTFCQSPSSEKSIVLLQNFAKKSAQGEICGLPPRPDPKPAKTFDDLSYLCNLYGEVDLFLWLQFKFLPRNTDQHQAALARKESALHFINEALANADKLTLHHDYIQAAIRHRRTWETENPMNDSLSLYSDIIEDDNDDEAYPAFS